MADAALTRLFDAAASGLSGAVLWVDPIGEVGEHTRWDRLAPRGRGTDLPDGPFDAVVVRLPRGRETWAMSVDLAAARLAPTGTLRLFGANDDGIRSARPAVESRFAQVRCLDAKGHGRVWEGREIRPGAVGSLMDWARPVGLDLGDRSVTLWSVPGLFAHGRLDPGSALLLTATGIANGSWLDFGCGVGTLGAFRGGDWVGVDADVWAVAMAQRNHPDRRIVLGADPTAVSGTRFRQILSNPPLHAGSENSDQVAKALATESVGLLEPGGELWVVTPRRVPFGAYCAPVFTDVCAVAQDERYRVWRASGRRR